MYNVYKHMLSQAMWTVSNANSLMEALQSKITDELSGIGFSKPKSALWVSCNVSSIGNVHGSSNLLLMDATTTHPGVMVILDFELTSYESNYTDMVAMFNRLVNRIKVTVNIVWFNQSIDYTLLGYDTYPMNNLTDHNWCDGKQGTLGVDFGDTKIAEFTVDPEGEVEELITNQQYLIDHFSDNLHDFFMDFEVHSTRKLPKKYLNRLENELDTVLVAVKFFMNQYSPEE